MKPHTGRRKSAKPVLLRQGFGGQASSLIARARQRGTKIARELSYAAQAPGIVLPRHRKLLDAAKREIAKSQAPQIFPCGWTEFKADVCRYAHCPHTPETCTRKRIP